jgi:hypothetical protein
VIAEGSYGEVSRGVYRTFTVAVKVRIYALHALRRTSLLCMTEMLLFAHSGGLGAGLQMIRKENREWDLTVQTDDFRREIGLIRDLRHTNVGARLLHHCSFSSSRWSL